MGEDKTAVGFKLPEAEAEQLKRVLAENGLTMSKFFRACINKFLSEDREKFLASLGFEKRFYWAKNKE